MKHRARNIALQLDAWQKRKGWTDAQCAEHLKVGPQVFGLWKSGVACPYPALVETQIGLKVQRVNRTDSGIIRL